MWEVNQAKCFHFPALSVIADQVLPTNLELHKPDTSIRNWMRTSPINKVVSHFPGFGQQHGVKINLLAPLLCDQRMFSQRSFLSNKETKTKTRRHFHCKISQYSQEWVRILPVKQPEVRFSNNSAAYPLKNLYESCFTYLERP